PEREPVGKLLLAIPAPDDPLDYRRLRKLQLYPALATFVGNPTMAVAEFAVVDVFELVNIGVGENAGGACPGTCADQRDIFWLGLGRINFQFVETGLGIGCARNRETQAFGLDRPETVGVPPRADGGPESVFLILEIPDESDRFKAGQTSFDSSQLVSHALRL